MRFLAVIVLAVLVNASPFLLCAFDMDLIANNYFYFSLVIQVALFAKLVYIKLEAEHQQLLVDKRMNGLLYLFNGASIVLYFSIFYIFLKIGKENQSNLYAPAAIFSAVHAYALCWILHFGLTNSVKIRINDINGELEIINFNNSYGAIKYQVLLFSPIDESFTEGAEWKMLTRETFVKVDSAGRIHRPFLETVIGNNWQKELTPGENRCLEQLIIEGKSKKVIFTKNYIVISDKKIIQKL